MKKRNTIVALLLISGLLSITLGVSVAFFNYTRTGNINIASTGRINFSSNQEGIINLTNIFPIDPTETGIMDDTTKVGSIAITVTGDTTYDNGVEYLVSATNVNNTVGGKHIPISISATASGTLGTSDDDYFINRDTATSHLYKVLARDTISEGDQLMVGYIARNTTGINGTINIKAYIDKNKIAITDTPEENSDWQRGRTVFSTTEWNSLQSTGVSFQVRVEANEGIWVEEKLSRNDMKAFTSDITSIKSSITEIFFIKMNENEINTHTNLIDLTAIDGEGMVKAWLQNTKLYVASPGETYFPEDCSRLFEEFTNVQIIYFENINTSRVTNMRYLFSNNKKLGSIDISMFDTSNVTDMSGMFYHCESIESIDLSGKGSEKLLNIQQIFGRCNNLKYVNMSDFTYSGTNLVELFYYHEALEIVDFTNIKLNNVTDMHAIFSNCTNLKTIYVSNTWDVSNITSSSSMFNNCTSLKGGGTPPTTYVYNHTDKEYARIDGGLNSSTPGYLTLKTN